MFDEASLIPDKVWTVAQGGLSDGHAKVCLAGRRRRKRAKAESGG
jgi:hypothetical protein